MSDRGGLTYIPITVYDAQIARAATTTDPFNAIAEPRRRQILDLLAGGERPVGEVAAGLDLAQPQASKHLRVLREVGLVGVRRRGRQRIYRLNADSLRPIHDWLARYERIWNERFDAIDTLLEETDNEEEAADGDDERPA